MIEPNDNFEPGLESLPLDASLPADHGRTQLDVVLSDFTARQRRGEKISIEDFALKYPELADEIRELFPLVAAMERLKERKEASILKQRLTHDLQLDEIGGCRIVRELGRGGMGIVFEALQERKGNRRVAIKLLPWRHLDASRFREQFQREAELTASLRHRNIVPVIEYGEADGFSYYVMQFIDGVGLDWIIDRLRGNEGIVYAEEVVRLHEKRIAESGELSVDLVNLQQRAPQPKEKAAPSSHPRSLKRNAWTQIARIGLQVADAMHYAHKAGTAHRDIKPANLLLDKDGKVWVTDFGLAQTLEHQADNDTKDLAGTLRYMAPEQFAGQFDERSDIYSLGVTLYELITLKPAFTERDERELLRQIIETGPQPPRRHNSDIPIDLDTIVRKTVALNPDERFQNAGELAGELRRFVNKQPLQIKRTSLWQRLREWYCEAVGRN